MEEDEKEVKEEVKEEKPKTLGVSVNEETTTGDCLV